MDQRELEALRYLLDKYNAKMRRERLPLIAAHGDSVLNCVLHDIETSRTAVVISIEDHRRGLRLAEDLRDRAAR